MIGLSPRRRRRGVLSFTRKVLAVALLGLGAWSAGFFWFIEQIPSRVEQPETMTDAIVVLTGGGGRLGAGLELLARGRARKLFVSGVYRGVEVAEILRAARRAPEELECCVDLGHDAVDTRSNANETGRWMAAEGFTSLRLVTASYHMPRSRVEFRRAMPTARMIAHPVFQGNVHIDEWWRWPGTTALLIGEYNKYLIAVAASALAGPNGADTAGAAAARNQSP